MDPIPLTLAFDSSTWRVDLSLFDHEGWHSRSSDGSVPGSEVLPGLMCGVLNESGHTLDQIRQVLFCVGPGRFTSLRVGLATLMGFFLPDPDRKTPYFYALSSLWVRALGIPEAKTRVALIRAGHDKSYAGFLTDHDQNFTEMVLTHAELARELEKCAPSVIGLDEPGLLEQMPFLSEFGQVCSSGTRDPGLWPKILQNKHLPSPIFCTETRLNYLMSPR